MEKSKNRIGQFLLEGQVLHLPEEEEDTVVGDPADGGADEDSAQSGDNLQTLESTHREGTEKVKGGYENIGKTGKKHSKKPMTKKKADAQRKAMFYNGFEESDESNYMETYNQFLTQIAEANIPYEVKVEKISQVYYRMCKLYGKKPDDLMGVVKKTLGISQQESSAKSPYAVAMSTAEKETGDKPPLKKSTIVKADKIAKAIKRESYENPEEGNQVLEALISHLVDVNDHTGARLVRAIVGGDVKTAEMEFKRWIQREKQGFASPVQEGMGSLPPADDHRSSYANPTPPAKSPTNDWDGISGGPSAEPTQRPPQGRFEGEDYPMGNDGKRESIRRRKEKAEWDKSADKGEPKKDFPPAEEGEDIMKDLDTGKKVTEVKSAILIRKMIERGFTNEQIKYLLKTQFLGESEVGAEKGAREISNRMKQVGNRNGYDFYCGIHNGRKCYNIVPEGHDCHGGYYNQDYIEKVKGIRFPNSAEII